MNARERGTLEEEGDEGEVGDKSWSRFSFCALIVFGSVFLNLPVVTPNLFNKFIVNKTKQ